MSNAVVFGASEQEKKKIVGWDGCDDVIYVNNFTPRDFVGIAQRQHSSFSREAPRLREEAHYYSCLRLHPLLVGRVSRLANYFISWTLDGASKATVHDPKQDAKSKSNVDGPPQQGLSRTRPRAAGFSRNTLHHDDQPQQHTKHSRAQCP